MDRPANLPEVPNAVRYERALRIMDVSRAMTAQQRKMLVKHYRAPDRTVTATELAQLVDYPDWNTINLQYGTFAQNLADRMNWLVPPGQAASYTLAWFEKLDGPQEQWQWHMHDELAKALEALGWVQPLVS